MLFLLKGRKITKLLTMWACVDTNLYDLHRKINYIHTEKMDGAGDVSIVVHQLAYTFNNRNNTV